MDFPKDVAGVALIDSATPYQFDLPDYPSFYSMWRRGSSAVADARPGRCRTRLLAWQAPVRCRRMPVVRRERLSSSPRELRADRDEFAELRTVFRQDQALTSLGGKPLFVLTAGLGQQSGWFRAPGQAGDPLDEQRSSDDAAARRTQRSWKMSTTRPSAVERSLRWFAPFGLAHRSRARPQERRVQRTMPDARVAPTAASSALSWPASATTSRFRWQLLLLLCSCSCPPHRLRLRLELTSLLLRVGSMSAHVRWR